MALSPINRKLLSVEVSTDGQRPWDGEEGQP